jgi:hypothetical protein
VRQLAHRHPAEVAVGRRPAFLDKATAIVVAATLIALTGCAQAAPSGAPTASNAPAISMTPAAGATSSTSARVTPATVSVATPTTSAGPPSSAPVSIDIALQDSTATSAEIGPEGDRLTTTSVDGTEFVLTVPAGALLSPEEITMTPLAGASGGPLGDNAAVEGVQLEPDGLVFLRVATLEIRPPELSPDALGFSTHGGGENFHLFPSDVADGSFVQAITHFSDYGYFLGIPPEAIAPEAMAYGDDMAASTENDLAVIDATIADPQLGWTADTVALAAWADSITEKLGRVQDELDLELVTGEMLAFLGQVITRINKRQAQGVTVSVHAQVLEAAVELFDRWLAKGDEIVDGQWQRCLLGHPAATLSIFRWYVVGGTIGDLIIHLVDAPIAGAREILDRWEQLAESCMQFEVEWDTTVVWDTTDGSATTQTKARTRLGIDAISQDVMVQTPATMTSPYVTAPIGVERFTLPPRAGASCTLEIHDAGTAEFRFEIDTRLPNVGRYQDAQVDKFRIGLGVPTPPWFSCVELPSEIDLATAFWEFPLEQANEARPKDKQHHTVFELEIQDGGDVYASLDTNDRAVIAQGGSGTVTQEIRVVHVPQTSD